MVFGFGKGAFNMYDSFPKGTAACVFEFEVALQPLTMRSPWLPVIRKDKEALDVSGRYLYQSHKGVEELLYSLVLVIRESLVCHNMFLVVLCRHFDIRISDLFSD